MALIPRINEPPPGVVQNISPAVHPDIGIRIGLDYEQRKDYVQAKDTYERVLHGNPKHAKALQRLGWLYHLDGSSSQNQDLAIQYLINSLESDSDDAESWHLFGRVYMARQENLKAFEAYQQAVYRDTRNPTFWCSAGALYFQANQYLDALDMYARAADLDRNNPAIAEQIQLLRNAQANGVPRAG